MARASAGVQPGDAGPADKAKDFADYAKAQRRKYLKETAQIRAFLAAPENLDLLRMYESVVDEFQL